MKRIFQLQKILSYGLITLSLSAISSAIHADQLKESIKKSTATNQIISNIEGILEIRGVLAVNNKTAPVQYLLHLSDGKIYYLDWQGKSLSPLKTGMKIRILKAQILRIENGFNRLIISPKDIIIVQDAARTAIPDSFGQQKTIVFLLNFQNQPNARPWDQNQVKDMVFNTINNMYYESSYQQTTVVGDVIGWYVIALNSTATCDTITNNMPVLAQTAATNAGVDLGKYTRRVYMFPNTASCTWAGLGSIGKWGNYSNAWINGYNDKRVTGHELGHNLGLWHSHFLQCPGSSTEGNCSIIEYGDNSDIMGGGNGTHFNSYQKEILGWLGFGSSPVIQTVTTSGSYTINPYEIKGSVPANDVKGLKILKKNLPNGSKDYYYLEFRQGIGFDAPLASCGNSCDFTRGVLVHMGNSTDFNTSNLLDMTSADKNMNLVALLPGQSFVDPNAPNGGLTITADSISTAGAKVTIKIGTPPPPPTCQRKNFTMTIAPTMQWVNRGGSANYTITVNNTDTAGCTPKTFTFYANPTTTWIRTTLSTSALSIAPGKSGTLTLNAKTSLSARPGSYTFTVVGNTMEPPAFSTRVYGGIGVR